MDAVGSKWVMLDRNMDLELIQDVKLVTLIVTPLTEIFYNDIRLSKKFSKYYYG